MKNERNYLFSYLPSFIFIIFGLIISKNLIYLVAIFGLIMGVMSSIFKTKNLDYRLLYICITPLLILQGVTLLYIYAFKSVYLYDVYWILYYLFTGVFIFCVLLWVYYLIYRRNS